MDVIGCAALQAMEVDTQEAVDRFRAAVGGFRAADLGLSGVAEEVRAHTSHQTPGWERGDRKED